MTAPGPSGPCRCPDCDPAIAAGHIICGGCKGRSYALDAAWITDRLILATFGPMDGDQECRGDHRGRLVLIDLDAEDPAVPQLQRRICKGTVRTGRRRGRPCIRPAAHGSAYCRQHDPARQEAS